MKKKSMLTLLGIALVVAIISTGVFYGLFVTKLSSNVGSGKSLIVAATSLKAGTILSAGDLKPIPWPAEQVPKGMFESADAAIGNTLIEALNEGEPVLSSHLASAKGSGGAGSGIPSGMRAVSIHVTDSASVLSMVHAGQKVDIQVVAAQKGSQTGSQLRTALEDIQVLSVASQAETTSQGTTLPALTVLAGPADADVLALADATARIRVTLRNPLDSATRARQPLTLDTVMHAGGTASDSKKK